jgi:aminoglycoside phosphotransferase (APT) family kinase protein
LAAFGVPNAGLLGSGNEANVYALGRDRVVRVMQPGSRFAEAEARAGLLREIAGKAGKLPFRTPVVEQIRQVAGRIAVIEQRLDGEPVAQMLGRLAGAARTALLADYLAAAGRIAEIALTRDYFGHVMDGPRAARWGDFAAARLADSAGKCPPDLRDAVMAISRRPLPEPSRPALVHLDYFPGNVLAQGATISAVLDFGSSTLMGDARMEAWSAVAYLDAEISPQASDADRRQAMDWLAARGLAADYPLARKWLAAWWSFANDDASLMAWCRRILLDGQ